MKTTMGPHGSLEAVKIAAPILVGTFRAPERTPAPADAPAGFPAH